MLWPYNEATCPSTIASLYERFVRPKNLTGGETKGRRRWRRHLQLHNGLVQPDLGPLHLHHRRQVPAKVSGQRHLVGPGQGKQSVAAPRGHIDPDPALQINVEAVAKKNCGNAESQK